MASNYFVPHHEIVVAEGGAPTRWLHMLHGIFGSGANWRPFARRLTAACPAWGVILVDQRGHGHSPGAPPPHTLAAAADDVLRLEEQLGLPIGGIAGHSFGGKVALTYLARRGAPVAKAFVLDAWAGQRDAGRPPGSAQKVLVTLESIPMPIASRERFAELLAQAGYSRGLTDWLAMSLRREGDAFTLRLDLPALRSMLDDYHARDLRSVLEDAGSAEALHMVVGGTSEVVDEGARAQLTEIAGRNPHLYVHLLERAGHWVHVDDPEGLFAIFHAALSEPG